MRVCIGIICIGQSYLKEFETTFKPSVVKYAERHGYDLKIFTEYFDPTHTHKDSICFNKFLVPKALSHYDMVVMMDADIWISDSAPAFPICEKIGIVNEPGQFHKDIFSRLYFVREPTDYYLHGGDFILNTDKILNTGLIICRPDRHSKFFEDVYAKYVDRSPDHHMGIQYEQICLGYELQSQSNFEVISNQWNYLYLFNAVLNIPIIDDVYFLHFAGYGGAWIGKDSRKILLENYLSSIQRKKRVFRWGIRK